MDYKDKVVNAEVILPNGYSIDTSGGTLGDKFKLHTEDTLTLKLLGDGGEATPLKGVVVVAEDENNALQAGDNGLAVKVSPAANNLLELKQGALYVTAPEINIPISPKEGNALTNITSEGEEGLYVAPTKVQEWLYDSAPGVAALPGAFGYGMTNPGGTSLIANSLGDVARSAHNLHPGRYYTFTTKSEEMTGITEIIWLDNGWGDKTSQTATKLVLFFGKDGHMKYTIRGNNLSDPAVWYDLLTAKQANIHDRTAGVAAIPGSFGYGMAASDGVTLSLLNIDEIASLANQTMPGRYYAHIQSPANSGVFEIIWLDNWQNDKTSATASKLILFYGADGSVKYTIRGSDPSTPVSWVDLGGSSATYSLSIGTVSSLQSGQQATASITGDSPSQVLNLGIPKGADGQTIKSVNAVVKEIDSAQQVTLTFTMTDDSSQQASFNIPFSPQPTMRLSATSGNFSFNYSDIPSAKNAAGRSGSSIYLKTTVYLNRSPAGSTDVMVDVRLTEIPCTEDGTYLDYDIYAEYPSVVGSGQPTVAVWLILPTVPTHTIDPKTKVITKLLRGDGLSGLNGIIPIAGADEQVHEFKYFLQYSYLNN
ncbi:hypothetical protein [Escherichia coli]|uniref:hypothetical protein n=1 Tax=Escherichia coli TaxID=562 RepID=UPI0018E4F2C7|nr:hypothetical protein [Escherichia coli]UDW09821.1 hypothetical protein [Escherichia phage 18-1-2]UJQ87225.1 hypothetical protein [Escherichia phage 24-2-1]UJQ87488.1 hypothetical protein [Escherichia phage 19-1-2]UOX40086.1 hypothetical protein [Escherichia phage vB_EcoM_TH18]